MNKIIVAVLVLLITTKTNGQQSPYKYNNTKNIVVRKAAVVSAHTLASYTGMKIMKLGGNAFDAAIATQFALAVVYPGAGNLGGGGFMIAHINNGKDIALDYREMAPSLATRDMYLDSTGSPINELSMQGHLASGVPGSVAGIFEEIKYAKLPLKTLINPAIELAEKGFAVTRAQAASLNSMKATFLAINKNPVAFVKNTAWQEGDTLIQIDLANTLKRIRDKGAAGFYEGETARFIAKEMRDNHGIITEEDLKKYKAIYRTPLRFNYKNTEIITMPLPSSGGIILQQLLAIATQYNLQKLPFQSAKSVQLIVEAERRAFADRAEYMGDEDFVKVPVKTLTSKPYLKKRMKDFIPNKAGNSVAIKAGQIKESEQTTHLSVIDEEGNAVSITTTLNDNYGSKTVITGGGFIMNNEMDDFSVKPGVPNMYGALGNEKNAISPGKRMLSSMTPTIVLKEKRPYLIVGTPGGTTIPTSVFQTIINCIDYKLTANDAINKPKFHHQWLPDVVYVEKDFPVKTIEELQLMGYSVVVRGQIGRTELIIEDYKINKPVNENRKFFKGRGVSITRYLRKITAVADNRGDDDAKGF
jgi:gamma-glutamyltranspeptidase / glutathione hydrolase